MYRFHDDLTRNNVVVKGRIFGVYKRLFKLAFSKANLNEYCQKKSKLLKKVCTLNLLSK